MISRGSTIDHKRRSERPAHAHVSNSSLRCSILALVTLTHIATAAASRPSRSLQQGPATPRPITYWRCCGISAAKRACLAYNLYYNIKQRTFVVFVDDLSAHVVKDSELWFYNVTIASNTEAPDPDKTLTLPGLNAFWFFYHFGSWYSIGHAMLHELYPLYQTLNNLLLGHVPLTFSLMVYEESLIARGHPGVMPEAFGHIAAAVRGRRFLWGKLCQDAADSGKEWIRLEAATLGDMGLAAYAWRLHQTNDADPNLFNNKGWYEFRTWMLRSVGVEPASRTSEKTLILLNDKVNPDGQLEERRRIHNIAQVEQQLRTAFPDAKVQRMAFRRLPWKRQLEVLARTSVFITTEGSSGFRLLFLPHGSTTIILSHPDNLTKGAAPLGAYFGQTFPPFHEVDKYFQLTYVRIMKYAVNVEHTTEYVNSTDTRDGQVQLYDAHIVVQLDRMMSMVKDALRTVEHHKSYHDSQTAYAALD